MTMGERLKEERLRAGLSQTQLAEQCGISKNTQLNYEKGDRSPDGAYLEFAARLGIDVLYVVTGRQLPSELNNLSQTELDVIGYLRDMSDDDRATFVRMAQGLSLVSKGR